MILIFIVGGAKADISFCIRSAIPGNIVVPPDKTVFAYKSLRISTSHFIMELYAVSWIPEDSIPMKAGRNRVSGHLNLSLPMVMTCPSGNSYDFSKLELLAAVCISCSKSNATYASFSLISRTISRSAVVVNE